MRGVKRVIEEFYLLKHMKSEKRENLYSPFFNYAVVTIFSSIFFLTIA